jgi:hypothetical protein
MTEGKIAGTLKTLRSRCWSFYYRRCQVGFPWFWPARPAGVPAMVEARRLVRQRFGSKRHAIYRVLAQFLTTIAWPPAALLVLWQARQQLGSDVVTIRRAPKAFWAAMRYNVLPTEYFVYRLWQPRRSVNIDSYLYTHEAPRFFKLFNQASQPNPIDDKLAFYELCKANGVPSPEILAAFSPTGALVKFKLGTPPKRDLFVKPRISSGTENELLRWQGVAFEGRHNSHIRPEDLGDYLAKRAQTEKQTLIVQPALSNLPDLDVRENAELATVRLVTGLSADGQVVPIFGFFIDFSSSIGAKTRVALIDVASGRLMSPPENRVRLAHQVDIGSGDASPLPDWDAALRHVKVAHESCYNFAFVGWDVAFTELGPVLLEGNAHWAASEYQRLSGEPLGHTMFANILATRLRELKSV